MKTQLTSQSDGQFDGNKGSQVSTPGDAGTSTQGWQQAPNEYTSYKRQMTQAGWDGSFIGIKIPSPTNMDGDNGGSQLGSFSSVSFDGFNLPGEQSGPPGPDFAPSNGNPDSGQFPGVGDEGEGGF